jgi:hypothetical protein
MSPEKIKRSALGALWGLVIFLIFTGYAHYDKQRSQNRDDAKLKELQRISSEAPTPSSFLKQSSHSSSRAMDAGIYDTYRTLSDYQRIKGFYINYLTPRGWELFKEEDLRSWISSRYRNQVLTFRKQNFLVIIEYRDDGKSDDEWNCSVNFIWRCKISPTE